MGTGRIATMRPSLITGIVFFLIGLVFSVLANGLLDTESPHLTAVYATSIATIIFVVFSALFLGMGAGLIIHWIIGLNHTWKAGAANVVIAGIAFLVGIGGTIGFVTVNGWTALQFFITTMMLVMILLFGSIINFLSGIHRSVKRFRRKKFWKS